MSQRIELTGKRFGRLVVKGYAGHPMGHASWLCKCDCGKETIVNGANLKTGHTQSCGCYMHDRIVESSTTHGHFLAGKQTRLYAIWAGMKRRCCLIELKMSVSLLQQLSK